MFLVTRVKLSQWPAAATLAVWLCEWTRAQRGRSWPFVWKQGLGLRGKDPRRTCFAWEESVSVEGGDTGRENSATQAQSWSPLPLKGQRLPNSYEGGVVFHVFPVLLFLALNPFWKFPGEQRRRASQVPFVSPLQRWKVEAKDKKPFLCPELLFFILLSPLCCFSS